MNSPPRPSPVGAAPGLRARLGQRAPRASFPTSAVWELQVQKVRTGVTLTPLLCCGGTDSNPWRRTPAGPEVCYFLRLPGGAAQRRALDESLGARGNLRSHTQRPPKVLRNTNGGLRARRLPGHHAHVCIMPHCCGAGQCLGGYAFSASRARIAAYCLRAVTAARTLDSLSAAGSNRRCG